MKSSGIFCSLFLLFALHACSETESSGSAGVPPLPSPVAAKSAVPAVVRVPEFVPPATPEINAEKARRFADASSALLLLGQQWVERLEKADESEKIQILAAYAQAREQMVTKMGLAGMAEFNWIQTKAVAFSGNKAIFTQAGIKVP